MRNHLPELLPSSVSIDVDSIVIEPSLVGKTKELLASIDFASKQLLIVCDSNTSSAMAQRIMGELEGANAELLVLPGTPNADDGTVASIRTHPADALIAVGSGTISDLCKYASFLDKRPYAVFATAPSMNGYVSSNASLSIHGHKKSVPAQLPRAVFCDLQVLAAAPTRLIRSGLGDSLCRPTAQADWLLSHLLLGTHYSPLPFDMLKPYEQELFASADKLTNGDLKIMELLMKTLLVSGIGMVIGGGSYPASQGEHLIAHTMEMKHGKNLQHSYHGEQIGVCTLTMAKVQQELLSRSLHLVKRRRWETAINSYFGTALSESVMAASKNKHLLRDQYHEINARIHANESEIRDAIRQVTLPESFLYNVLLKAGAPTTPVELGWKEHDFELAVAHARFIRDRFTFLDLI